MAKLSGWKRAGAVLWLFTAMAIAARAQTFITLVNFDYTNGENPAGTLVQGIDGTFYGTTAGYTGVNCSPDCGTIFRLTPGGSLETLYRFCSQPGCPDGNAPAAPLVLGTDGSLYGTTSEGADCALCGTVFKLTPEGDLTTQDFVPGGPDCAVHPSPV